MKLVLGFVPFLLFTVLCSWIPVGWAALAGLVAAVAIIAATARGGVPFLPVVQAGVLLVMALVGLFGGPTVDSWLVVYGRGLVPLVLGLVIVATAVPMPFTAPFARATVPEADWHSPLFLQVNRRLSAMWGGVVLLIGLCHILGAHLAQQGVSATVLIDWGVPILALVAAAVYTRRVATHAPTREART
ncbi:hypothetical protein [Pseudonocardia ailaonensis]|uniref:hypothetical protein n=1 Tax=Pseudonocardia ailaonensis TaxID=367279 RepID=UPI0031E2BB8F